ncbi:protein phosphatase 2C domain-containing protein [Toxoplasma gondii TgCatPRC2]|uniref:Protein phosphatase 2C domain-containing protein n=1 Tax=Toxoplasma gondii TgCatPRC2 TaxID=1130821 RepID=A0A151HNM0_TOXGO|nr:protein phosphatase 2C domain-containing protein [Toxoplasma gondii TgCatPRC2]
MFSSAWSVVSTCCIRRHWSHRWRLDGKAELGAEYAETDDGTPTSPVEELLHFLPSFSPATLSPPSIPLPVALVVSRRLFPLARSQPSPLSGSDPIFQLLCDPSAPPLLTALRFLFVAAAAGGRVRPAYYDRSGREHLYLLPFFEGEGEEPVYLCVCNTSESCAASRLASSASLVSVSATGSANEERSASHGRILKHRRSQSCFFVASESPATGEHGVSGSGERSKAHKIIPTSSAHSLDENVAEVPLGNAEGEGEATERGGDSGNFRGSRSRVTEDPCCAIESERTLEKPFSPQASTIPGLSLSHSGTDQFFGPPCPTCGGLRLRKEAWEQLLSAAVYTVGVPLQLATSVFEHTREARRTQSQQSMSWSRSSSSSLRRSVKKRQRHVALRLLEVLSAAARAAGREVEAAAARAAASSPASFCVIGAFSDKWFSKSFQVKEVLILPPAAALSIAETRRCAGLFGITGDAFGLRSEAATTIHSAADALAADLALASASGPVHAEGLLHGEGLAGVPGSCGPHPDLPALHRNLAAMSRALDELQRRLPCQFVNQEQAFVCRARGVCLGGIVAGVGPEAQQASDVVALKILQDLLVRLHVAPPQTDTVQSKPSILRRLTADRLQQILLDSMRGVAASLERPPAFAPPQRTSSSSLAPSLLPLVSLSFSKPLSWETLSAPTGDASGSARTFAEEQTGGKDGSPPRPPFNNSTSGCAASICVVHEASKRLLVCQVGDVTAVLARPACKKTHAQTRPSKMGEGTRSATQRASSTEGGRRGRGRNAHRERGKEIHDRSAHNDGSRIKDDLSGSSPRGRAVEKTDRMSAVSFSKRESKCRSKSVASQTGSPDFFGLLGYCSEMDRDVLNAGFSFEAVVLTREHTLREEEERKRIINAGIVPLGHISEGAYPFSSGVDGAGCRHVPALDSSHLLGSSVEGSEEKETGAGEERGSFSALGKREWRSRLREGRANEAGNRASEAKDAQLHHQLPHQCLLSEGPACLFLCPDTDCPPLRCTRLLGMVAAQPFGVCSTPDVTSVNISNVSSFGFVVVASAVIWDLLEPQEAVDLVAYELRRQHIEALRIAHARRRRIARQHQAFLRLARRNLHVLQDSALRSLDDRNQETACWAGSFFAMPRDVLRRLFSFTIDPSARALLRSRSGEFLRMGLSSRLCSGQGGGREESSLAALPQETDDGRRPRRGRSVSAGTVREAQQWQGQPLVSDGRLRSAGVPSGQNRFPSRDAERVGSPRRKETNEGRGYPAARVRAQSPQLSSSRFALSRTFTSGSVGAPRRSVSQEDSLLREVRQRVDSAAEAAMCDVGTARAIAGLFSETGEGDESEGAEPFPVGLDFQAAATLVVQQFMEAWQLRREGISMPDATVLVIPFRGPSRGPPDPPAGERDSDQNRRDARRTREKTPETRSRGSEEEMVTRYLSATRKRET